MVIDATHFCFFTIVNTRPLLMDLCQHFVLQYAGHWRKIGELLGLPCYKLDNIQGNCFYRTIPCCNDMLKNWLRIDATASWRKLFNAIESPAVAGRAPDKGSYVQ